MVFEDDFTEFVQKCYKIMPDRWKQVFENQGGMIYAWYPKLTLIARLEFLCINQPEYGAFLYVLCKIILKAEL